ncbi:hypothetical protein NQZ68_004587 [Dissostichus eleginoides]|nr:hypothetical protein NQZ68_004587 [Dissostichus eleginoides]
MVLFALTSSGLSDSVRWKADLGQLMNKGNKSKQTNRPGQAEGEPVGRLMMSDGKTPSSHRQTGTKEPEADPKAGGKYLWRLVGIVLGALPAVSSQGVWGVGEAGLRARAAPGKTPFLG